MNRKQKPFGAAIRLRLEGQFLALKHAFGDGRQENESEEEVEGASIRKIEALRRLALRDKGFGSGLAWPAVHGAASVEAMVADFRTERGRKGSGLSKAFQQAQEKEKGELARREVWRLEILERNAGEETKVPEALRGLLKAGALSLNGYVMEFLRAGKKEWMLGLRAGSKAQGPVWILLKVKDPIGKWRLCARKGSIRKSGGLFCAPGDSWKMWESLGAGPKKGALWAPGGKVALCGDGRSSDLEWGREEAWSKKGRHFLALVSADLSLELLLSGSAWQWDGLDSNSALRALLEEEKLDKGIRKAKKAAGNSKRL